MSQRALYPLGTASQVPTARRSHHAAFLRWDAEGFLFDPGEGAQRQMTLAGLAASDITAICITHFHGDHCLGLPGIIQRLSLDQVPHEVAIYYPASGQVYFDRLRRASIFAGLERLRPVPVAEDGEIGRAGSLRLEARRLSHEAPCLGYRLVEEDGWRALPSELTRRGLRGPEVGRLLAEGRLDRPGGTVLRGEVAVRRPGQRFAFVMDTRPCEGAEALAEGADLLVCESTFLEEAREVAARAGHMTARQAAALAAGAGARRLMLTHFSQRYPDATAFLDEARPLFSGVVVAEEPGLEGGARPVQVPPRR